ncbi:MAG: DNA mismatch endonuclease Vsr [Bacteroidales bacterium]|nr:DNA mismatch endonuclease Vsr [Bacteroidales bacterium]MBR5833991.1 DNA mismatch endonuclease Vsr [Bacteroidales bacterium]
MSDKLTPQQRSQCMSRIRGKDTKPEILVRKGLHARGFRFRLQDRKLPGRPDIVLPKYGVAIMVNGCFWHGHKGCRYATKPKSNVEFWQSKIQRNQHRDEVTSAHLEALGWHVITIWECELRSADALQSRLDVLADEIRNAGRAKDERSQQQKASAAAMKKEREQMLERQSRLEAEINAMFPIPKRIRKESFND